MKFRVFTLGCVDAAATVGVPERRGDGVKGRGVPGEARQRGGGSGGVSPQQYPPHPLQDLKGVAHSQADTASLRL